MIELQRLEDHHIFPQSYLKKHGFNPTVDKVAINSIANRTLISDSTNKMIQDQAPADYLLNTKVFSVPPETLLPSHFINTAALTHMASAVRGISKESLTTIYDRFRATREAAIIERIRDACGVKADESGPVTEVEDE